MYEHDDELTFEAEPLPWTMGAKDERTRTLETVARWLVGDLFTRGGVASADELTNAAFAVIHPELGGRKIAAGESTLVADWKRIKNDIVAPSMRTTGTAASTATPVGLPALGGVLIPAGYTPVKRGEVVKGLARTSRDKPLVTVLQSMIASGQIRLSREDLDTFVRISNVETSGFIQTLNTWDSAVVSIGFFQLTLLHGKLQRWIRRAPAAFARYGIALEPTRKYEFPSKKTKSQTAIVGAATTTELRWNGWRSASTSPVSIPRSSRPRSSSVRRSSRMD